jgi:flagellar hook-associated protein 3 FlgL
MTMRMTAPMAGAQALLDLARSKERYNKLDQQVTSGNRIVNVEDDPAGAALILDFQSSIGKNNAYMAQADSASFSLQNTETSLDTVINSVMRLQELGQTGVAADAAGRATTATEVDGLRTSLLSVANTQASGKYLFAGSKTTTVPFVDVAAVPASAGPPATLAVPQSVAYNGNSNTISLDISASATVATNLPGDSVFFGPGGKGSATDLFAQVTALRDSLQAPVSAASTAAIQTAQTNLDAIFARFNAARADVGGRQAGITDLKTGLTDLNTSLGNIQNNYQAVDYATAAVALNSETIAQQASLSVMAKISQKSLFDYIG